MPFTEEGFLALKLKVQRYVRAAIPSDELKVLWPDHPPKPGEPDFTFTLKFDGRSLDVTLSAADVANGCDWRLVLDDKLNSVTVG